MAPQPACVGCGAKNVLNTVKLKFTCSCLEVRGWSHGMTNPQLLIT